MVEVKDKSANGDPKVAVVKKYANRRLYNTATSSYVTLDDLARWSRQGEDFVVYDAKTGEDITRSVLTQIIVEEDSKGQNLLPINFLRQLIGFYGDSLQRLPAALSRAQHGELRAQPGADAQLHAGARFGRFFPFGQFEEMARQNMALFQRAATMFTPLPGAEGTGNSEHPFSPQAPADADTSSQIKDLNEKIEVLQKQISELATTRREPPDPG